MTARVELGSERVVDIAGEYVSALNAVKPEHRTRLAALGFSAPVTSVGALVGLSPIAEIEGGLYVPDDAGPLALILPAWDGPPAPPMAWLEDPSRIIDLVAWRPAAAPEQMLTRCGFAGALGEWAITRAFVDRAPLRVFRTPGSWVRAGGENAGAVIIDWNASLRLLDMTSIIAEDIEHGSEVKAALQQLRRRLMRRVPPIRVPVVQ